MDGVKICYIALLKTLFKFEIVLHSSCVVLKLFSTEQKFRDSVKFVFGELKNW